MRINLKQSVLDYEGKPIRTTKMDSDGIAVRDEIGKPIMVDEIVRNYFFSALNDVRQGDILTNEEKSQIHQLNIKLFSAKEIDLTPNDRELLKRRIEKVYNSPMICGLLIDFVYPEDKKTIEPKEKSLKSGKE